MPTKIPRHLLRNRTHACRPPCLRLPAFIFSASALKYIKTVLVFLSNIPPNPQQSTIPLLIPSSRSHPFLWVICTLVSTRVLPLITPGRCTSSQPDQFLVLPSTKSHPCQWLTGALVPRYHHIPPDDPIYSVQSFSTCILCSLVTRKQSYSR